MACLTELLTGHFQVNSLLHPVQRDVLVGNLAAWITHLIIESGIKLYQTIDHCLSVGWIIERHMTQYHTIGLCGFCSCSSFTLRWFSMFNIYFLHGVPLYSFCAIGTGLHKLWNFSRGYTEFTFVLCHFKSTEYPFVQLRYRLIICYVWTI